MVNIEANFDEAMVLPYQLPELLKLSNGAPAASAMDWRNLRRPEILRLFETEMYGKMPGRPSMLFSQIVSIQPEALSGIATLKELILTFDQQAASPILHISVYLPNSLRKPVPMFLGLNFTGNQTVGQGENWPVEYIISRGYGLATVCYTEIAPDTAGSFTQGVYPLFYQPGQILPEADECGAIGAWAWGLSRVLDFLQTDPAIDYSRVTVMGHSRLGKAALWAGACDPRFAMVISNNSGCGGAALSRRRFGETVRLINDRFPYWFCRNFHRYNDCEDQLPVDQHMLIALIAPRPVYIASAQNDLWADPRGEFLSARHASPVYELLGTDGLLADEMPEVEKPVLSTIGYHIRRGDHAVTLYDWERFMDFTDKHS
jgi:hypothetical protein